MKIKVGVMGSAGTEAGGSADDPLRESAARLGQSLAAHDLILLTGGTTGLVHVVGKSAHDAGVVHIGISPASFEREHVERYKLPTDACDLLIYTGFGLKGRNVVLVRSCDIVIFIAGTMGSLNEFTIAYDEGKVIGCLKGSGGVADEADYLLKNFSKRTEALIFEDSNANTLLTSCLAAVQRNA
jgi:uncharacterized protein (TIGR00725 family)